MSENPYIRFLPEPWRSRAESVEPESTWWNWPVSGTDPRAAGAIEVHIARTSHPDAGIRVMLVHGAGGHSGLVWPLAAILATEGCEVLAPDLPLYGRTRVQHPSLMRYTDWIDMLSDLIVAETDSDPRPLVIVGASMGGMLGYEVAHRTGRAAAVVATCLLDFAGDPDVVRHATKGRAVAKMAPLLRLIPPALGRLRIPVTWFAPIKLMSKNPDLAELCANDPLGAASRLPLQLVADLITYSPPAPENYRGPQVLLLHPGADDWTPPELSTRFAERIAGRVDIELLTNCGHFPIEQPGIDEAASHLRALRDQLRRGRDEEVLP